MMNPIIPHVYKENEDTTKDACQECHQPEGMPFHCSCETTHPFGNIGAHYTHCPFARKKEEVKE